MTSPTLTCPEIGLWRAWLDREPAGQSREQVAALADHLADCPPCRATVGDLRRDADFATAMLGRLAPSTGDRPIVRAPARTDPAIVEATGRSLRLADHDVRATGRSPLRRWRAFAGGIAAALLLSVLVGTPAGQTAAAQFLAQFRGQRFAPITVDLSQGRTGLEQLERLGTVRSEQLDRRPEEVKTIDEASRRVGIPVRQPDVATLPNGVSKSPKIAVLPTSEVRFTFDRDKAREYFQSVGRPDASLPDKYHGVSLVASVPAAALLLYERVDELGLPSRRAPGLAIGQAGELQVGVDGNVTFEELRDFLLGLPGLPDETVRQLRAIQDWRTSLPIPIPVDKVAWQPATIAGGQGLLFADKTGLGSGALWQRDGRVYGVGGGVSADELRRVADSLRQGQ